MASTRRSFADDHPDVFLIDPNDAPGVGRYLRARGVLAADDAPTDVSKAGDGNMNCTLRVVTPRRRVIVKQGRPWVEKYDHIPAPWDRTIVEAAFYETVAASPDLARRMPALIHVDRASRVLVLEDVGGPDFTDSYAGAVLVPTDIALLIDYLSALHRIPVDAAARGVFANREMRALNHEHLFQVPLARSNGLDLDGLTPGLQEAADELKRDVAFVARVAQLGERYLAAGDRLVHGDFFPGSWLRSARGPVIIDPEFCFLGAAEFDVGVMLGHLILADQPCALVNTVHRAMASAYDLELARRFAGVEIMRRLIGVAQLPLEASLERKRAWLARARELVTAC